MKALALATIAALAATLTAPVDARLTRLEILKREIVADGQAFGAAGRYEKLTGTAYFEADPADERGIYETAIDILAALHDQAPPELLRVNVSPQKFVLGKKPVTVTFTIDAFDRGGFGTNTPSTIQVHRPDLVTYPVPLHHVGSDLHSSRLRGTFVARHGDPLGLYRFSLSLVDVAMNERLWWSSELQSLGSASEFVVLSP